MKKIDDNNFIISKKELEDILHYVDRDTICANVKLIDEIRVALGQQPLYMPVPKFCTENI